RYWSVTGVQTCALPICELLPDVWQRMGPVRLDAGVLGFTLCLAALTSLLFGLAPALGATKVNLNETLKNGARAVSGSRSQRRLRSEERRVGKEGRCEGA